MAPLQAFVDQLAGWLYAVAFLFIPGAVATVCWAPFLLSGRIRSLFAELRPSDSPYVSYVLVGLAASLPFVVGVGAALVGVDTEGPRAGGRMGNAILTTVLPLSVGYVVGAPLVGAVGLPRIGVDWDPTGYGLSTWLLLAAGGAWYAAVFAVPLTLFSLVVAFPA
jgi:hypothetical protein